MKFISIQRHARYVNSVEIFPMDQRWETRELRKENFFSYASSSSSIRSRLSRDVAAIDRKFTERPSSSCQSLQNNNFKIMSLNSFQFSRWRSVNTGFRSISWWQRRKRYQMIGRQRSLLLRVCLKKVRSLPSQFYFGHKPDSRSRYIKNISRHFVQGPALNRISAFLG